jgi:hypothetical protein
MAKYFFILSFLFSFLMVSAQNNSGLKIHFVHLTSANSMLQLDSGFVFNQKDSVVIHSLRYYISDIKLFQNNVEVYGETNGYHLIDLSDPASLNIELKLIKGIVYDEISFNLGIDSATNTAGALGGALDPSKGMYWSWQSGYINLKIEGKSNLCPQFGHQFQYHLGGYLYPNLAIQNIRLKANRKLGSELNIAFDLEQWLLQLPLTVQQHIMSPSKNAVQISIAAAKVFKVWGANKN